jgi:hypothetical protein
MTTVRPTIGVPPAVCVRTARSVSEPSTGASAVMVDETAPAAQPVDLLTLSESNVTAPFRASSRPATDAPAPALTEVRARMVPRKVEPVPSVAELPTCQKTLHGEEPLTRFTRLEDAVVRVDAAWNRKTALGSPCASSVSVPVTPKLNVHSKLEAVVLTSREGLTVGPPSTP